LEFNVPFQHEYGYIRDERVLMMMLAMVLSVAAFSAADDGDAGSAAD